MGNDANNAGGANTQAQQQTLTQNAVALKKFQEETTEQVLAKITLMQEAGAIKLPANYSAGNAVKLGWLYLMDVKDRNNKPAVEVCTRESICNTFFKMVIKGLSVAKKQCYFIVYGNQLTLQEDYRGNLMIAKRDTPIADVNPQVIYEGDNFVYTVDENGLYQLVKHETKLENINIDKITGAYAVVINKDGSKRLEIMTIAQIRNSWTQGAAGGKSGAHVKFTDQMCKKTVINRACKIEIGSSDDSAIMGDDDDVDAVLDIPVEERKSALEQGTTIVDATDITYEEVKETPEATPTAEAPQPEQTAKGTKGTQKDCPI
ncbi:recombination protein RecT [Dysgonomonas sp. PFB1-18]|uniref:RecT family recombinase n=1 Tax=unclassified Dysgonomonas TaxID=2630389 RepID=UPI0024738381|nr:MULTISPECIES: RecT family recombinase [unclassified Dysgonomonas]MDH6308068.1 recombination protein RecT [Dysgonomonas sp. PF1-14]MDH6339607.1 recombination protein RecT [Dysgonomonas sp. PF1-16]MDH6381258.1 recombination protein RecT [Dysgonomonas sp. PFB1-18]MDH6398470.1 recombination protein RecT [Dysgonomonas sp. PF1-23]